MHSGHYYKQTLHVVVSVHIQVTTTNRPFTQSSLSTFRIETYRSRRRSRPLGCFPYADPVVCRTLVGRPLWAAVFTFNPYLLISINELMISIIHLLISINELLISINDLLISINELLISINTSSSTVFIDINKSFIDINKGIIDINNSFIDINKYGWRCHIY